MHRDVAQINGISVRNGRQDVLNLDGTTDGGCETVDPIDADDKYTVCPNTDQAIGQHKEDGE